MKKIMCMLLSTLMIQTMLSPHVVTAVDISSQNTFTAIVNVFDHDTGLTVSNAEVRFVEYDKDAPLSPEPERKPQANLVRVIAEWNTSEQNPYTIEDIPFEEGHFYAVEMDKTPNGYCFWGEDHFTWGIHTLDTCLSGEIKYDIELLHQEPLPNLNYPLDIERDFHFSVIDESTGKPVTGLNLTLAQMAEAVHDESYSTWKDWYCEKTFDEWNNGDEPEHIYHMPIHFDDSSSGMFYGIKISNLPDGYVVHEEKTSSDGYVMSGYFGADYRQDIYFGRDNAPVEEVVYIYPEDHSPVITTTTSTITSTTTTTTSTSTTSTTTTSTTTTTFEAEEFFVVVGTFDKQYTQLRYLYPNDSSVYAASKVILTDTDTNYAYGDVLIYNGEPQLTKVRTAPENPAYSFAYHYTLDDESSLSKVGNCTDVLEQKNLTFQNQSYDGSGHYTLQFIDVEGIEYSYGLNTVYSSLGVDVVNSQKGEVYTFAFYKDTPIIPLVKQNDTMVMSGDFDGDKKVMLDDVNKALELYTYAQLGLAEPTVEMIAIADVNNDKIFDLIDVIYILHYYNYNEILGITVTYEDIINNKV